MTRYQLHRQRVERLKPALRACPTPLAEIARQTGIYPEVLRDFERKGCIGQASALALEKWLDSAAWSTPEYTTPRVPAICFRPLAGYP